MAYIAIIVGQTGKIIITINKDEHATVFQVAGIGLVGDLITVNSLPDLSHAYDATLAPPRLAPHPLDRKSGDCGKSGSVFLASHADRSRPFLEIRATIRRLVPILSDSLLPLRRRIVQR